MWHEVNHQDVLYLMPTVMKKTHSDAWDTKHNLGNVSWKGAPHNIWHFHSLVSSQAFFDTPVADDE